MRECKNCTHSEVTIPGLVCNEKRSGLFGNEAVGCGEYRERMTVKIKDKVKKGLLGGDEEAGEFGEVTRINEYKGAHVIYHEINPMYGLRAGGYIDRKRTIHVLDKEHFERYVLAHEMEHWRRWNALTFRFLRFYKYTLGGRGLFSIFFVAFLMFYLNIDWLGWTLLSLYLGFYLINHLEERRANTAAKKLFKRG